MGKWTQLAQKRLHEIEADKIAKNQLLEKGIALAAGNVNTAREFASIIATTSTEPLEWEHNMKTNPGDLVYSPDKKYAYLYSGKDPMTHANQTFFPGASGVNYWTIIPKTFEDIKVYPDVSGIIVAVKQDEVWWNSQKTEKYKWNAVSNNACSWYPGQAGVHQWVKQ